MSIGINGHTCIKDDGGTPNRKCDACEAESAAGVPAETPRPDPKISESVLMDVETRIFYAESSVKALAESVRLLKRKLDTLALGVPPAAPPPTDWRERLKQLLAKQGVEVDGHDEAAHQIYSEHVAFIEPLLVAPPVAPSPTLQTLIANWRALATPPENRYGDREALIRLATTRCADELEEALAAGAPLLKFDGSDSDDAICRYCGGMVIDHFCEAPPHALNEVLAMLHEESKDMQALPLLGATSEQLYDFQRGWLGAVEAMIARIETLRPVAPPAAKETPDG